MPDDDQFNVDELLKRFGDCETSVVLWREGWETSRYLQPSIREAVLVLNADLTKSLKREIFVHTGDHDLVYGGERLQQIIEAINASGVDK